MTCALHDFADLRTRPVEVPETAPKPCCTKCGAVLRAGNTGALCAPCGRPAGLELPGWALEMAEHADRGQLTLLGKLLRSQLQVADPEAEPEPDAPFCACGCGGRVLRGFVKNDGRHVRTGPWLKYRYGHWKGNQKQGKGVMRIETQET